MPKKSATSRKATSEITTAPRWAIIVLRLVSLVLLLASLCVIAGFFIEWQIFELLVSFTPHMLIIGSAVYLAMAALVVQQIARYDTVRFVKSVGFQWIAVFMLSLINAVYIGIFSLNSQQVIAISDRPSEAQSIRVGTFNALFSSPDFAEDSRIVQSADLDIVSLQEVDEVDVAQITRQFGYEYSHMTDCDCSASDTEVAIISRYPIRSATTLYESSSSTVLRSELDIGGEDVLIVYTVHMFVPYIHSAYEGRANAYDLLSDAVNSETNPVVVMGDFNSTIFSPQLRMFSEDTSLKIKNVTERAWPRCSWYGASEITCLRLDYVYAPFSSEVYDFDVLETTYSDHRPVIAEFSL